jgi:hypothetical protein
MIKLKSLLTEVIITTSEFDSVVKQAKKETGQNHKIPSKTKQMCKEVGKYKVNVYDYKGNKGKKRDVNGLMYQYYAYVQGWGHGKFKGPADWFLKGGKFDKILGWIYENGYNRYFDYSYLKSHVSSDLQTAQIVSDIRKGDEVEPAYYLAKDYYNSFAQSRTSNVFDQVVNKVDGWLKDNKIETR